MHALELPEDRHPFFFATQAHPELTSRPLRPQPIFLGLIRAAIQHSGVQIRGGLECARPKGECSPEQCDPVDSSHA